MAWCSDAGAMPSRSTELTAGSYRRSSPTAITVSKASPARRASLMAVDASTCARPRGRGSSATVPLQANGVDAGWPAFANFGADNQRVRHDALGVEGDTVRAGELRRGRGHALPGVDLAEVKTIFVGACADDDDRDIEPRLRAVVGDDE